MDKINCDGACKSKEKIAAIGVIGKDNRSRVLTGIRKKIIVEEAKVAEVIVIK